MQEFLPESAFAEPSTHVNTRSVAAAVFILYLSANQENTIM